MTLYSGMLCQYPAAQGTRGNRRTLFEILLNGDHAEVTAFESVLTSGGVGQFLDGLLVAQMRSLDTNSPDKSSGTGTEAGLLKLYHGHGQVLRLIESRSASVDIDHKLLPGWSD